MAETPDERRDDLLGSVMSFAVLGRLGPLRLGVTGAEADRLLGGGTGLGRAAPAGFRDGSLEVWAGPGGVVELLGFDAAGADGSFRAPAAAGGAVVAAPSFQAVVTELARRGCTWEYDPALTFDEQFAIRTEVGASLVFARVDGAAAGRLASVYRSAA